MTSFFEIVYRYP